jgi:predicted nucleic acid-binding Zn ribbon protein
MRRRAPRPVGQALDALTASVAPRTLLAEVQRAWPGAAGPLFATAARPTRADEADGTVTVRCTQAVLAQELDLMSELVRGHLNEALGRPAVNRLRIQVGPG